MHQKVCLVTGASRGIGRAICERAASRGFRVCAGMRTPEPLAERGIETYRLDVTDRASIESAVGAMIAAEGRIDVLVNNAGMGLFGPVEMASDEEMRQQFEVNVFGVVRMIQATLPQMRRQGGGRIINVSSVSGIFAPPAQGLYAASKHALEAITQSLALDLSPWNIDALLVNPGFVKTRFHERMVRTSRHVPGAPYTRYLSHFEEVYREGISNGQDLLEAAGVVVSLMEADQADFRKATSEVGQELLAFKLVDPSGNAVLARLRERWSVPEPSSG